MSSGQETDSTTESESSMFLDDRLNSYESFHNHEWAAAVFNRVRDTPLYAPFFSLCVSWKGVANTFRMPWLMVQQLKHYADGQVNGLVRASMGRVQGMTAFITQALGDALTPELAEKIRVAAEAGEQRVLASDELRCSGFSMYEYWKSICKEGEIRVSIRESMRLCFSGLFFAYETFLVDCVRVAKGDATLELRTKEAIRKGLVDAIGADLARECWESDAIVIGREVRNILAHRGGRDDGRVAHLKPRIVISHGEFQITPEVVRGLYAELTTRVGKLVDYILALPVRRAA